MFKGVNFMALQILDLPSFINTPLIKEPFPYVIVPNFICSNKLPAIQQDYPDISGPGSYPVNLLKYGQGFQELLQDLESNEFRAAIAEKFSMQLTDYPILTTVRGATQKKDGRIHSDTKTKLITVLLYLNSEWESQEGRLRLLRNAHNLEDMIVEIPPLLGTLLVFKVTDNSWHGHKPFVGKRRAIQMNYVINQKFVDKELARHRFSAKIKKLKKFVTNAY
jgi:hypothetical protein